MSPDLETSGHRLSGAAQLMFLCLVGIPAVAAAQLPDAQRAWMQDVLSVWQTVATQELRLPDEDPAWVVFFGPEHVWHVNADLAVLDAPADAMETELAVNGRELPVAGWAHGGAVRLPDGETIPPQLILFASTFGAPPRPYFVMAMPAIWRATPRHADDPGLEELIAGVFVHEITHTTQAGTLGSRVDRIVAEHGLDDDEVDDDIVQRLFQDRPGHREAYERERDLLFAAAAADDDARARELAGEALAAIEQRRENWYSGEDAFYADLEEIFLTFEGVANWAAVRAMIIRGAAPAAAIAQIRRGGKWWSQDEGLALFLVLERLGTPWRDQVFGPEPGSALELLAAAVAGG